MSSPDVETLMQWVDAIRKQRQEIESRIEPLLELQAQLEQRESLVTSLIASCSNSTSDSLRMSQSNRGLRKGSVKEYVIAGVTDVLTEAGRPLHINDIHRRYLAKGFRVPGAGEPVNLTTHIRDGSGITSPSRGVYGLANQVAVSGPGSRRRSLTGGNPD